MAKGHAWHVCISGLHSQQLKTRGKKKKRKGQLVIWLFPQVFPREKRGKSFLDVARRALLKHQDLAISALESLPKELFPQFFLDAFHFRCTDILKAIGQVWPFPTLPLGRLLDEISPRMTSLEAVLDGIDLLLAQEVHLR